jgi:hypothetical protein
MQITDSLPAEPMISQEYMNAKYKAWLQRRGLTDPAFADELKAFEARSKMSFKRNRNTKKTKNL